MKTDNSSPLDLKETNKTLWRKTLLLWMFSLVKLPLVFWLKPRIMEVSNQKTITMMKYRHKTKNHVGSMYFGVLCVGAELAPGIMTMHLFEQQKEKFTFLFKDFHAEFFKRCEGDVYFTCDQGEAIQEMIVKARETKLRQNRVFDVIATVPSQFGAEVVGKFQLTLSLKMK